MEGSVLAPGVLPPSSPQLRIKIQRVRTFQTKAIEAKEKGETVFYYFNEIHFHSKQSVEGLLTLR